jgi:hypothetical protein
LNYFYFRIDYVADIYQTLTTSPRAELKLLEEELKQEVPEPVHTMLAEKEDRGEAISKYKRRKEMETVICPPTCPGINFLRQRHRVTCWLELVGSTDIIFLHLRVLFRIHTQV